MQLAVGWLHLLNLGRSVALQHNASNVEHLVSEGDRYQDDEIGRVLILGLDDGVDDAEGAENVLA